VGTVRELRKQRFLSQRDLATAAGISRTTLAAIEDGRNPPRPRTARAIAAALAIEPAEIDWPTGDGERSA